MGNSAPSILLSLLPLIILTAFLVIVAKEYGYCSLVKTCKTVMDRAEDLENRIITKITPRERLSLSLWDKVALREAVVNAIVHNDYSQGLVPKFEVFSDRIEITSAGTVHPGQEQTDFFAGYSHPINQGLMRVFKDLKIVEHLGSGMPRILSAYSTEAFEFSGKFLRLVFPMSSEALELEMEVALGGSEEPSEKTSEKILQLLGEKLGEKLGKNEERVLRCLAENPKASIKSLVEAIELSDTGIEKIIARLKKKGLLNRVGPAKGGHWEVCDGE